jgi:hypothetical protein
LRFRISFLPRIFAYLEKAINFDLAELALNGGEI